MSIRVPIAVALAAAVALAPAGARAQTAPDPDPWWSADKALHFGVAAGITGGGYAIATQLAPDVAGRAALAATLGIGAGLGKEVFDSLGYGTPSWKDFLWDVLGTSVAVGVAVSIDFGVRTARGK